MSDLDVLIKNYYDPLDQNQVENIINKLIAVETESGREKLLRKNTPFINKLKTRFKKLVVGRNELAREYGYNNYFDFISNWDKVPKDKLNDFLKNGDATSKKILGSLPKRFKDPDWLTGNYNNFNFDSFVKFKKINIPDDVIIFLNKKLKVKKEVLNLIHLEETRNSIFTSNPDFNKRRVVIKYSNSDFDIETATGLAHEYGHAIEQIKLMSKGVDPDTKSFYYHETYAIDVEMKFTESISENARKARIGNFLYTFANAFFEREIYTNPDCDYDAVYAETRNRVCPQMKQTKNPFYVFNTFLIEYPCYSTIYSVIYNEYVKNKFSKS